MFLSQALFSLALVHAVHGQAHFTAKMPTAAFAEVIYHIITTGHCQQWDQSTDQCDY